jgi:hypothetical protein
MKRVREIAVLIAAGLMAATGFAGGAIAQAKGGSEQVQSTPRNWTYEIRDGKRVPKGGDRIVNADGSWREEFRQGSCVTIKEKTAAGEYKESRRCD